MATQMIQICGREIRVEGRILRVAHPHGDRYRFLEDPAPVIDGIRASELEVDLFTFSQRLPESQPRFPYAFEWDNFAVLPVTTFEHWWTHDLGCKTRNMVRHAEKSGVVLCEVPFNDRLVAGIHQIYNECPVRQRRRFPHYGKAVQAVYREEATFMEDSIFIAALFQDRLIGFTKLVQDETRTQAGLMNIISMLRHRDKAAQNALIAHAVRVCAERGIRHLVYSRFDYGRKENDGLRAFKERNGFRRIDMPKYYVPVTSLGRAALRLGWHKGISSYIPEVVASRLRDLRAVWYERKYARLMGEA